MPANSNTIQIEIQIDDKGGVKVLRQIGTESEKAGRKGEAGFRGMSKATALLNRRINIANSLAVKLGAAFGLWKMWHIAEGFLDVAVQTENYRLRLNALLGSVREGNVLFDEMADFAARVPFSYDQIMASATQLAGVMSGGVNEIKKWIPLIADLAVVSGLDIQTATEQIIRMYSAGAASADLFRERGILAMLGFQAGVSYSAEETRKRLMAAWKDPESKFKDATDEMAKSWGGLVSMLGDKWFQFRSQVMESGPFQVMKERLGDLLTEIDRLKKNGQLDIWAADMADGVLASVDLMMAGFQGLSDFVYGFRATFGIMAEKYYNVRLNSINSAIQNLETLVNANVNVDLNQKQIDDLKAMRAEVLLNKAAGAEMAEDNIQKMDQYTQKIQIARDELAKLRADMQARRGERPDTDTDLSVTRKTTVAGLSEEERKQIEKEEAKLWEYDVAGAKGRDDALLDAHEAMLEYDNNLFYENAKKKLDMTDQMYSDLKFKADGYYTYRQNQLMEQADDYEQYTGGAVLAHQWLVEQLKELDKERLEASQKNNKYLTELSERTSDAIEENFSSFFKDVFRHELDSAGDYFRAFCNSLLDSYADVMGQMAKQTLFGGGSSGSSGLLGSAASWISGLFGGGSSTSSYVASDWEATLWHTGKGPGRQSGPTRSVPASVFYDAQRFHRGRYPLADNELPAIITRDETVLPPGVKPVNNTVSVSMPITIQGGADERFASILMNEMEKTADRVVREHLR